MQKIAKILLDNPEYTVIAVGYANAVSRTAAEEKNVLLPLSKKRAEDSIIILNFYGISKKRITPKALGGGFPFVSSNSEESYKNRRVEFTIVR